MNLNQFVSTYNGRHIDVDGVPRSQPYQCVDLTKLFINKVYGLPYFIGNAKDWFYKFNTSLGKKFTKIANNHNSASQIPKAGDIVVYGGSMPGSQGYGHVDIVLSTTPNGYWGFDQNWNGTYAHKVWHPASNYRYVVGWLHPKSNKPVAKPVHESYTVKKGDTLSKISSRYHTTLSAILKKNPKIKHPNVIYPGEKITIK